MDPSGLQNELDEGLDREAQARKPLQIRCSLQIHDDSFSKEDILLNPALFAPLQIKPGHLLQLGALPPGTFNPDQFGLKVDVGKESTPNDKESTSAETKHDRASAHDAGDGGSGFFDERTRYVFAMNESSPETISKLPNLQVSVSLRIASAFRYKSRRNIVVATVEEPQCTASHVEVIFRDEYLTRADMWRLVVSELAGRPIFKGQKLTFLSTIQASLGSIYLRGQKVRSAYFGADTKPIFRSQSARFVLFIQLSKEMWDFDIDGSGEIMFNRLIDGFLPDLFNRWQMIQARHIVSIVLFSRIEYDRGATGLTPYSNRESNGASKKIATNNSFYKDFYRVVVSDMVNVDWTAILQELKREFKVFVRDISIRPDGIVAGCLSSAARGNVLEAINLASLQFSNDHVDRDLVRTGVSIVLITPGIGLFEVDSEMLTTTTDSLIDNGIGIDLVCLAPMPLHSIPLFKYRSSRTTPGSILDMSSGNNTPRESNISSNCLSSHAGKASSHAISTSEGSHLSCKQAADFWGLDEWKYAIPHWVDVSFWTPSPTEKGTQMQPDKKGESTVKFDLQVSKAFVPRARMMELQMMGIMENETSNISIPYLRQPSDPAFAGVEPSSRLYPYPLMGLQDKQNEVLDKQQAEFGLEHEASVQKHSFSKETRGTTSRNDKYSLAWMEDYDTRVFCHPLCIDIDERIPRKACIKPLKARRKAERSLGSPSSVETSFPIDPYAPPRLVTSNLSTREYTGSFSGTHGDNGSSSHNTGLQDRSLRPTSLSRHISFGLRGLGAAPPKALASTEVSQENANSASLSSRNLRRKSSTKSSLDVLPAQAKEKVSHATEAPTSVTLNGSRLQGRQMSTEETKKYTTRPIAIRSNTMFRAPSLDNEARLGIVSTGRSPVEKSHRIQGVDILQEPSIRKANSQREFYGETDDSSMALSLEAAMASWFTVVNPSNPSATGNDPTSRLGRWQHVFPRPLNASSFKWKSLCSPAAVPLTTESFPSARQLTVEYQENMYELSNHNDSCVSEDPGSRKWLVRELIASRLSHGFQIVVGPRLSRAIGFPSLSASDIFNDEVLSRDGSLIFMSKGGTIHQISCLEAGQVQIKINTRRTALSTTSMAENAQSQVYRPAIRTVLSKAYVPREITFTPRRDLYSWSDIDSSIVGYKEDYLGNKCKLWRARFVLIPVDPPSSARRPLQSLNEDNEEEIRLEGIRKLTQLWQRNRRIAADEQRSHPSARQCKETNPLDIIYQTRNPSEVIASEVDKSDTTLLVDQPSRSSVQMLEDNELYQRSNMNIVSLVQTIQGEKGVRLMDRRWHWRLHYNCFIGFELTTWLLENFRDVETREDAVGLGNELMDRGLFLHVEQRHNFRDGNFFYQIASEYRTPRPESKNRWFASRKSDRSLLSTPPMEHHGDEEDLPPRSRSSVGSKDNSPHIDTRKSNAAKSQLGIALSKRLRYDVDHRKRSYRPEIINLHYDILHNPDNCYHIQLDWMDVTSKLVEDAIVSWGMTADRYGLRLVEVPIGEASSITDTQPFRGPFEIKLTRHPSRQPPMTYFDTSNFDRQSRTEAHYHQKALLKKFNFVLDLEAAKDFPPNAEVTYSWGQPDYRYPQYIHRSGAVLAQITDEGNFILLENKLNSNRKIADPGDIDTHGANRDNSEDYPSQGMKSSSESPFMSPSTRVKIGSSNAAAMKPSQKNRNNFSTAESVRMEVESFCHDAQALQVFYDEVQSKIVPLPVPNIPVIESSIPTSDTSSHESYLEGSPSANQAASTNLEIEGADQDNIERLARIPEAGE